MIDAFTVEHREHVCRRPFDEVVAAFEGAVGSVEQQGFDRTAGAARDAADFEARVAAQEGSSGFMRFLTVDHGAWLALLGVTAKARMYTIGNPLMARTMIVHDIGVGLNVPIRLMIYEDTDGAVRLAYDLPSSLMSRLRNAAVTAAAHDLDAKLDALARHATGAAA